MPNTLPPLLNESLWRGRLFGGSWRYASSGSVYPVREPATGQELSQVGLASAADVELASMEATEAQAAWMSQPFEERAAVFRRAAAVFELHRQEIVEWLMRETGSIEGKAEVEVKAAIGILHMSAAMPTEQQGIVLPSRSGRLSLARRVPHGVVGVISPFNFPLILSIRAIAPALAAGNAVVHKPDPQTAVAGGILIARIFEEAGLPPGLLHVLPGTIDVGEALCADPRVAMIAFTGSTAAGRRVGALAGQHLKRVCLELGGKNSLIVLDDADVETAASNARWGAWLHQGQICMTTGRILVHERIADEFVERLATGATHLPYGDPTTRAVALGPLINDRQVQRVHAIVEDTVQAGASLRSGGRFERLFYCPTVLDHVRPGMRAFEEEIFGPVAAVTRFSTDDEAVALANMTEYGLSAGVISNSVSRAMALGNRLRVGLLHINDQTVADEPHVPFGGRGASGNGSRIGGMANWEEFTQWQWVTIDGQAQAYPF